MAKLHNTLKPLRTEQGFTQASLADAVGVSRKTINTIENHVFTPSTLLSMQIAQVLNLTVHDIFYVKDD